MEKYQKEETSDKSSRKRTEFRKTRTQACDPLIYIPSFS
jgi:hypothetical protein